MDKDLLISVTKYIVNGTDQQAIDFIDAFIVGNGDFDKFFVHWEQKATGPNTEGMTDELFYEYCKLHGMLSIIFEVNEEDRLDYLRGIASLY